MSSADILRTRGGRVQMRTREEGFSDVASAIFGAKKLTVFRNLRCVHTDKGLGELSQCGYFSDKSRGWSPLNLSIT